MRAWILAAVAALGLVGQAEAATYTLTFKPSGVWNAARIVLDLPSFKNVSINQFVDQEEVDGCECGYFDPPISDTPMGVMIPVYASSALLLETDASGRITFLDYYWDDWATNLHYSLKSAEYSVQDYPEQNRSIDGYWQVSAVPLPATAPMLIGAVVMLGLRRRVR